MFLQHLRAKREDYALTQYDICRYLKVSDVAYRTWEQGVRKPSEKHLVELKRIFRILETCNGAKGCTASVRETNRKILDKEF